MEYYDLQKAVLKEAARPSSEKAVFSIEKPAADYAADRAAADTRTTINAQKLAQEEKQFLSRLLFAHDQLKTFSKQNDLATIIAAAGIPVQLAANKKMEDSANKQTQLIKEIIDSNKTNINTVNLANAAARKKTDDFINQQNNLRNPPQLKNSPLPDQSLAGAVVNSILKPKKLSYSIN